jgi:N-acyl-D-amino-acid deacylase
VSKARQVQKPNSYPKMIADVVVFDAENITDKATYVEPGQYCQGVHHLLVNGKQVIKDGKQTDAMPGEIVSRVST